MQTVFEFELPRGLVDTNGDVHRRGKMRLATAGDEIGAMRDPRVAQNPSYLSIVVLASVITEIEGVAAVVPNVVESLFTADLAFLQDMYQRVNGIDPPKIPVTCPQCGHSFEAPVNFTGEG
ncbi:MAG: phage tail assembly protein [Clostridiales Family XIII bacterium]|jgi:hypothetical protein|nr:phage tail assembly protein [Clostridiales Family XIII bacterium]